MDPLSIISGCAGLITAIGSLSISINTFVRSCREARSDLDRVSRELHSLQTVLELIEEDAKDDTKPFPPTIQHHVSGIVTNCGSVVLEVETCIKKYGDGRIKSRATWAINGQGDMEKLRSSLEAHKSALELALDMLSLSLTKEIKTNTTEIRNETAAIRDDTALILQEIAKLQARLPETAAAPNDYILQKFLEDMATYTETTLDVDLSYSDGMSSRALSIADEHDDSSTKSPQYNRPIIGHQDPAALVASQSSDSLHPRDTPKKDINHPDSPESHNHGHGKWPRTTREDIPHSPKRSSPLTSYLDLFHDKAVALGNDPQAPRLNALVSNPRNEETQDQIAPSPVRVHEDDSHRKHADSGTVQKDENSPNLSRTPTMPALNYSGGQSDQDKPRASKRVPQQPEHFVSTRSRLHQPQQVPYSTSTSPPTPTSEEDIIISPPETQVLSSIEGYHVQKLKGNIVIDLPAPERILDLVPHSPPPDRDEFTHTRFSLITCSPRGFATQSYPFRPALFAKPRETQFILVMQLDPNDKDFISRWDLIHDSIIYAQQKLEKPGASPDLFWKRVIVHLHLAHATKWGTRTADHPLTVLEAIGAKQNMNARVGNIESRYLDEPVENSSTIEGRRVHAIISEV
ncbi:Chitin synthase A [Fusarium acutatum]|uniref:chitin synthase n=1 Tax=Fusarium acutatum TaxID=78861 RepID=A0A8H4JYR6_9HYPO|nr:Chitin synthase A [Fusarium acutatum]